VGNIRVDGEGNTKINIKEVGYKGVGRVHQTENVVSSSYRLV
jgi:hypothetical protein